MVASVILFKCKFKGSISFFHDGDGNCLSECKKKKKKPNGLNFLKGGITLLYSPYIFFF